MRHSPLTAVATIALAGVFFGSALAAADKAHEALMAQAGGDPQTVYVFEETFDKVHFAYDANAGVAQGAAGWDNIDSLEYADIRDTAFVIAIGQLSKGEFAKAAQSFESYVGKANTQEGRVQAFVNRIEALVLADQPKQAAAAVDAFLAAEPKHPDTVYELHHKGLILLGIKDYSGADAAFQQLADLASKAGHFQTIAAALAAAGRAQVRLAQDDAAGALQAVRQAMDGLNRDRHADAYAQLGLIAAKALKAQGDSAGAIEQAKAIRFLGQTDIALPIQAEAHFLIAETLQVDDPERAFEYAAIGALQYGDQPAGIDARQLAKKIGAQISSDESIPLAKRQEYKNYLGRL